MTEAPASLLRRKAGSRSHCDRNQSGPGVLPIPLYVCPPLFTIYGITDQAIRYSRTANCEIAFFASFLKKAYKICLRAGDGEGRKKISRCRHHIHAVRRRLTRSKECVDILRNLFDLLPLIPLLFYYDIKRCKLRISDIRTSFIF